MNLAFLALATSLASTGLTVSSHVRGWPGYIGLAILGLGSLGLAITAVFTTDPMLNGLDTPTFGGQMHLVGPRSTIRRWPRSCSVSR